MINKKTFSNGLRLLTIPVPQVKSVAVLVLVGAGGRYETEKNNGIAHFLEHMLFQGTKNYPTKMDLGMAVDSIGAEYNGWTDKEYTAFYVKAESRHLETAVLVLSDLICHPLMKESEIEAERNVILQEIAMREDNPQIKAVDTLWETVFSGHPLGLSGTGEKESILRLQKSSFVTFKQNFYTSANVVVIVCGNFEEKKAEEIVEKKFQSLTRKKKNEFEPFEVNQKKEKKVIVKKEIDQAHICLGFPAFSRTSPKKYSQSLLDIILGSGFSSRLFQKIREEMRLAYYVGSEAESYLDTGIFTCFAGLDKNKVEEGIEAIWGELIKITNYQLPRLQLPSATADGGQAITNLELRRAKDFLRGHLVLKLEEPMDIASFYGIKEVLLGKTEEPEEILEKIEKVTVEEVVETASLIFKPERASLVVVGNTPKIKI